MLRLIFPLVVLFMATSGHAAEFYFDFSQFPVGQCPTNYLNLVSGEGKPGDWKILTDDVPRLLTTFSPNASKTVKRSVLAQTATDATDEHFPLLLLNSEEFGDFTFTARFKTVSGVAEQMAGIAFRARDEKNYYVVRFSSLGNTFRFYKFVNGQRCPAIGTDVPVAAGVWHDVKVICKGSQIQCQLDGKDCTPTITDTSFSSGKIGFWTKSDSVSYFIDAAVDYTPHVPFAKTLITDTLKEYPRLLGLKVFSMKDPEAKPRLIGSDNEKELGAEGGKVEADVIARGSVYFLKVDKSVEVTLPLRDRNGDVVAAVRFVMKSFPGETEKNAVPRAVPMRDFMKERLGAVPDLMQ